MQAVKTRSVLESKWQDTRQESKTKYPAFTFHIVRFGFQTLGRLFPNVAAKTAYKLFSTPRIRAKHQISDKTLESARLFEVLYGKQILKGYEWGNGEETILLVHGWESRGTAMRTFVPSLVKAGYRVVAMDGPGHGNSSGKSTTLPSFGGAIIAFINHVGGVRGIITHSFGGASSMYALSNIDNSIEVEKLVLIGVPSKIENVWKGVTKTLHLPSVVSKNFKEILEKKVNMKMEEVDSKESKNRMKVEEVLVVHDKRDAVVPFSAGEANFEEIDNASLLEVNDYGHYRMMKNPDLIKAVTDFIKS